MHTSQLFKYMKQHGEHTALRRAEVSLARHVGCKSTVWAPEAWQQGLQCVAAVAFDNSRRLA
jgi:hypothetical protein